MKIVMGISGVTQIICYTIPLESVNVASFGERVFSGVIGLSTFR
jgi:hypothetical protein